MCLVHCDVDPNWSIKEVLTITDNTCSTQLRVPERTKTPDVHKDTHIHMTTNGIHFAPHAHKIGTLSTTTNLYIFFSTCSQERNSTNDHKFIQYSPTRKNTAWCFHFMGTFLLGVGGGGGWGRRKGWEGDKEREEEDGSKSKWEKWPASYAAVSYIGRSHLQQPIGQPLTHTNHRYWPALYHTPQR